jgi:formate dehydrogenase iron-sulfur subunit
MTFDEKYKDNKMLWLFRKSQCFHCGEPSCMKACSSKAISKTDFGFVVIDHNKCIGCGYCEQFCAFGSIPTVDKSIDKSFKCTGCVERVANNLAPSCVSTCQPGALDFGDADTMMAKAEQRLLKVKEKYPKANLYGDKLMGGTTYIYILLDSPQEYGLPVNPTTPLSLILWKDIIQPLGLLGVGGATAAVVVGVLAHTVKGDYKQDPFSDKSKQEIGGKK